MESTSGTSVFHRPLFKFCFSYPQFVDLIRVGDDLLEVDDILVPQSGQNLHLSQGSLTVGLEGRENISLNCCESQ